MVFSFWIEHELINHHDAYIQGLKTKTT